MAIFYVPCSREYQMLLCTLMIPWLPVKQTRSICPPSNTCPPLNGCLKTCKNMSKCAFICLSMEYLGHIVRKACNTWLGVACMPYLRAYLSLLNYYGQFLQNVTAKAHPPKVAQERGSKICSGERIQDSFSVFQNSRCFSPWIGRVISLALNNP